MCANAPFLELSHALALLCSRSPSLLPLLPFSLSLWHFYSLARTHSRAQLTHSCTARALALAHNSRASCARALVLRQYSCSTRALAQNSCSRAASHGRINRQGKYSLGLITLFHFVVKCSPFRVRSANAAP